MSQGSFEQLIPLLRRIDRLTPGERAKLLGDPTGDVELGDDELEAVAGGVESTECVATLGCCGGFTNENNNTCCCRTSEDTCNEY